MIELSSLQKLLRRFVKDEIAYPAFHAEFVRDFLSIHHSDVVVEEVVNLVESSCADFDEQDISDSELKDDLSSIASFPLISIEMVSSNGVSKLSLPLSPVPLPKPQSGSDRDKLRESQAAAA